MDKIKIKIDGRVAEIESAPEVVTDNAEYEVEFAVDERDGWNPAVPMTALFVRRDARYTAVVMDVGETICTMPPQTGTNVLYIGLTQEEMRTTTPARIPIRRSVRTMTDFPPLPDKDVYAQILANFAGLRMLSGKGAPTTETAGKVNQMYRDETNNRLYVCVTDVDGYTWAMIGGGGGGGTVVTIDTTLTKSGQAADAKAAGDAIYKKLDKAQGVENAGMILGVDEDGNVAPENKPVQALAGADAPTTATAGVVGQEYYVIVDNAVTEMYVCTSALIGSYTWDKVEFGGGTSNAVQYTEQSLTDTQKQQARTNIGAGTSSFSGSYNDLTDTPIPDTTLKQSGKPADAKAVGEALDEVVDVVTTFDSIKVDKSQGTANAGKYLGVGNDGNVTVVDAPSSGGTDKSLGITSATVGQIAKITAVDSVGKPTGWEAVDMPSGGGETWELINEITLTETVNYLIIDKDANGNAFSLRRAKVECIIKLDESDPFTNIKIQVNGLTISKNATTTIKSGTVYYSVLIECMNAAGIMSYTSNVTNENYNWIYTIHKMGYRYNSDWEQNSITSVKVVPNDGQKPLGVAGTKIVIYGVKK